MRKSTKARARRIAEARRKQYALSNWLRCPNENRIWGRCKHKKWHQELPNAAWNAGPERLDRILRASA